MPSTIPTTTNAAAAYRGASNLSTAAVYAAIVAVHSGAAAVR